MRSRSEKFRYFSHRTTLATTHHLFKATCRLLYPDPKDLEEKAGGSLFVHRKLKTEEIEVLFPLDNFMILTVKITLHSAPMYCSLGRSRFLLKDNPILLQGAHQDSVTAHGFQGQNQVLWSILTLSTDGLLTYEIMKRPQLFLERPGVYGRAFQNGIVL